MGLDGRVYWVWKVDRLHWQNPTCPSLTTWPKKAISAIVDQNDRQTAKS